jgi:hypothetical protein
LFSQLIDLGLLRLSGTKGCHVSRLGDANISHDRAAIFLGFDGEAVASIQKGDILGGIIAGANIIVDLFGSDRLVKLDHSKSADFGANTIRSRNDRHKCFPLCVCF